MRKIFILFAAVLFASSMMAVDKIEVWGNWDSWIKHELTSTDGNVTASFTINLTEVKTHEFAIIVNESVYRVAKDPVTRTNNEVSGEGFGNTGNAELVADVAGDYTFTWTFAEGKLTVTYPIATILDETATDASAVKRLVNGQLFIERDGKTFNAQGIEVK